MHCRKSEKINKIIADKRHTEKTTRTPSPGTTARTQNSFLLDYAMFAFRRITNNMGVVPGSIDMVESLQPSSTKKTQTNKNNNQEKSGAQPHNL